MYCFGVAAAVDIVSLLGSRRSRIRRAFELGLVEPR
jgi:hypothetical protein